MIEKNWYTEKRPWGNFKILSQGPWFQVKELTLKPHSRISLHKHDEKYIMLLGKSMISIWDRKSVYNIWESCFAKMWEAHRVENLSNVEIKILGITFWKYYWEDDIERLEDDYGRV